MTTRPLSKAALALVVRHRTVIDAAPMADLLACGRLFHAAINVVVERSDDDMDVLSSFDDYLCEIIARREPATPQEFAAKTEYLFGRLTRDDVSDGSAAVVRNSIATDAARFRGAGSPASEAVS